MMRQVVFLFLFLKYLHTVVFNARTIIICGLYDFNAERFDNEV